MNKKIKIKIPATTSNFGSGFDTVGLALNLYNEIEVEQISGLAGKRVSIDIEGEGKETLPRNEKNIVYQAMKKVFDTLHFTPGTLHIRLINSIPITRGLGSSSAARIGAIVAANYLCGNKLSQNEIIKIATQLEGHPDNVVPALVGGFCISCLDNGEVKYIRHKLPDNLRFVVCVPDFEIQTNRAREILPKHIPFSDAIFNVSRSALLVSALINKRYDLLSTATDDKLHQPYRGKLIAGLNTVFKKALKAGALGVFISGSGPAVLAISCKNKRQNISIGRGMCGVFEKYNIRSKMLILSQNIQGTKSNVAKN